MTTAAQPPSPLTPLQYPDRGIDAPLISLDVPLEIARLRAEPAYDAEAHAGRTLAKYPDLRVVLEIMKTGTRLRLHGTGERMTLQVIAGDLRLWSARGESTDLPEGSFAAIDAELVHEIDCVRECAFLLTLAWPPARQRGAMEYFDY